MSTLTVFSLHACDDYKNNIVKTRYYIYTQIGEENGGLIDTPYGIEKTIQVILETIKKRDMVVQKIVFIDPYLHEDYIWLNFPCFGVEGISRFRSLSEQERNVFCGTLTRIIKEPI